MRLCNDSVMTWCKNHLLSGSKAEQLAGPLAVQCSYLGRVQALSQIVFSLPHMFFAVGPRSCVCMHFET